MKRNIKALYERVREKETRLEISCSIFIYNIYALLSKLSELTKRQ